MSCYHLNTFEGHVSKRGLTWDIRYENIAKLRKRSQLRSQENGVSNRSHKESYYSERAHQQAQTRRSASKSTGKGTPERAQLISEKLIKPGLLNKSFGLSRGVTALMCLNDQSGLGKVRKRFVFSR
ncbi:MAG: hypothetical protein ACFWTY_05735 [Shouchella clausii]|jgi:hypothetical protein